MSSVSNLICPWMGKECPGVSNCAPAVFASTEAEMEPSCPIVASISSLAIVSMVMTQNVSPLNVGDPTAKPTDFDRLVQIDQED